MAATYDDAMTQTEWINLDGVANMRDLGGLPTRDGGSIQPRRLIRSDNLQDLSPADVEQLVDVLGVSDVLDLRSETELTYAGPGPLRQVESLTHHHHSLLGNQAFSVKDALVIADADRLDRDAAFWTNHYLGYLTGNGVAVASALSVIAEASGAVIVHCAAGKDRTGTITAMALDVAGVPEDLIVADYAASGERLPQILARLSRSDLYGAALSPQALADQATHPETMAAFFSTLRREFGSAGDWLRTQGWSTGDVERLKARLTT